MDLKLNDEEAELLRDLIEDDHSRLILEIARTDRRAAREVLKKGETILKGIKDQLGGEARKPA